VLEVICTVPAEVRDMQIFVMSIGPVSVVMSVLNYL